MIHHHLLSNLATLCNESTAASSLSQYYSASRNGGRLEVFPDSPKWRMATSKIFINRLILDKWQARWSTCIDNKLFKIKPTLGEWRPGFRNSRKEEVVLSRLRIGHTYFSHSFILRREDRPECIACQEGYSVKHVLIDCTDLSLIRQRFYTVLDMKSLFETVSVDRILSFLKEVNLFSKI